MLPKKVVQDYFSKEWNDYYWLKNECRKSLLNVLLPIFLKYRFIFKTKPRLHQLVAFFIGLIEPRFLFQYDMGLGKTKILLDLMSFYKKKLNGIRVLVIVPTDINVEGWQEEIETHSDLSYCLLIGSTEEREQLLNNKKIEVFVVTYIGLAWLVCDLVNNEKKEGKQKLVINKKKIAKYLGYFDLLAIDEIHNCKNHESLYFKVLKYLAKDVPLVYGATGTLFGRKPQDIWAQFYLVDLGKTFGTTIGFFRSLFFNKEVKFGTEYHFDERYTADLHRIMRNVSMRYEDIECEDLPELVEIKKEVSFSAEVFEYYKPTKQELNTNVIEGNRRETENNFIKLRELCSGFIYINTTEEKAVKKNTVPVKFSDNKKAELLIEILSSIPFDSKVVVFHEFTVSGEIIEDCCRKANCEFVSVRGNVKGSIDKIKDFKNNKSNTQVLIANSKKAGAGGNFQKVANYLIFYESPVSPIIRSQCIKRVYRSGQTKKKVFVIDLIIRRSVEEKVLKFCREGKDLFDSIVNGGEVL